jgi:ankyrin repeat protein
MDIGGDTDLHLAADGGRIEVVALLVAQGADVNAKNHHGQTPLDLAAENGHEDIVQLLKEHGAKE